MSISPDLALAARYLRTLADIEQASAIGDSEFVWSLLDGIDPQDLRQLAAELEQAAHDNGRGTDGDLPGAPPHLLAAGELADTAPPSAPVTHTGFSGATP